MVNAVNVPLIVFVRKGVNNMWKAYKNDYLVAESKTWYGALNILVKQDGLTDFKVEIYAQLVHVMVDKEFYRIVKEVVTADDNHTKRIRND